MAEYVHENAMDLGWKCHGFIDKMWGYYDGNKLQKVCGYKLK